MVIGLGFAAGCIASLGFFDPGRMIYLYMLAMIFRNIFIAVADCATDGFSVDCGLDEESGVLQGWMSLGRTVGTVLGAVVGGIIARDFGYSNAIFALAGFTMIPMPANVFVQEEWTDEKAFLDLMEPAEAMAAKVEKAHAAGTNLAKASADPSSDPERRALIATEAEDHIRRSKSLANVADSEGMGAAKKKLVRRKSFVSKMATVVGFDWELLEDILGGWCGGDSEWRRRRMRGVDRLV